jgi:tetratricopeptide (TPR) repeat protein/predicted aspartyl protease
MPLRSLRQALTLAALAAASFPGFATCQLEKFAELPVTMNGLRPMVHAQINGAEALFIVDSGAFYSMLTPAAAAQFKLRLSPPPYWFAVNGIGGESRTWLTTVKTFTLLNVPIPNVQFLVGGNDLGTDAVGLLGQNVLRIGDAEYDLANGVIRLMRPQGCGNSPLAYWAHDRSYSVVDIERTTATAAHTAAVAFLNGARIRVLFDTGASTSVLSLEAAKRAGITPDSPGVVAAGTSFGIGRQPVRTWIAPFASFKVGDEEIRNTHLRIGETLTRDVDMLIGVDFFLSHRVYVANSQRKLYFTYNGGPVFNLTWSGAAPGGGARSDSAAPGSAAPGAPTPESPAQSDKSTDQPGDAAGFARRGAAFAARRDFEHAIADLTRACELAPSEASYFYQRGLAHWGNHQPELAMADFDETLKLNPDDLLAHVARAELHLQRQQNPAAIADLDAADRVAPQEAAVRLRLGELYLRTGQYAAAVAQFTHWINTHGRDDVQMPHAMNLRCWTRGLWGQELDQALADCDAAVKARPDSPAFFDSRGLVHLRRAQYDKAIADYDHALKLRPTEAASYYARGVAELRKGMTAAGRRDIAAATALQPRIAQDEAKRGITP